ncbi:ornithine carbamoyltransferase [Clostridium cavendishii DSM 21758]|uniref:Ornithine carbamoyltransferase n=1 Tax=Clostridium cavendishii DSM 21758 TaxID=1121302 RepID=A0A1M6EPJ7_9CLOT|nr:ornithine carbamoyltransferase [Clostridium cavendishii]SHI87404.1 ornithine carbamoyltransferase [Clostridium cavendishii DSM 21758]
MKKDLLRINDLTKEEILDILDLGQQLKYETKHSIEHPILKGKTLGMIFEKSSTRTRVSFEVGMLQLGGNALFLSSRDIQMGRGEPISDTARVLSRYLDGIMIRTFFQKDVENLAKYATVPIINGLTDDEHPCQVLADLLTIREYKKKLNGLKVCFIGDSNNMVNSLIFASIKVGMHITVASPEGFTPKDEIIKEARETEKQCEGSLQIVNSPQKAAVDADVLITDVWVSMGQEEEALERNNVFKEFQINDEIMKLAKEDAIVLHCLPAHREEEITAEIFEKHADEIFEEAENRLHVQKAILVKLMSEK